MYQTADVGHLPPMESEMADEVQQRIERCPEALAWMWGSELLGPQRLHDAPKRRDGRVETGQRASLVRRVCFREFALALAHEARAAELRTRKVVQIAREVQHQVSDGIARLQRSLPEFALGQRLRE